MTSLQGESNFVFNTSEEPWREITAHWQYPDNSSENVVTIPIQSDPEKAFNI